MLPHGVAVEPASLGAQVLLVAVRGSRTAVSQHVAMLSPAADEAVLRDAGFAGVEQFYAAFTWRGWVGYA